MRNEYTEEKPVANDEPRQPVILSGAKDLPEERSLELQVIAVRFLAGLGMTNFL